MRVRAAVRTTSKSCFPSSFLETSHCPLLWYESLYGFSGEREPKKRMMEMLVPTYYFFEIRKAKARDFKY